MGPDSELSESQHRHLVERIREELGRRRISRQKLADTAKISISTLEKALNGSRPLTLASIVRIEAALGITLRTASTPKAFRPDLGGYARTGVAWLEGDYLTLRPSFEVPGAIFAYRIRISWDDDAACLVFHESGRLDAPFSQAGVVSLPNKSGHIYLHTNEQGQIRVAILGRPQITGELYGLLTTLAAGPGNSLTPAAAPLVLLPWPKSAEPVLGRILQDQPSYSDYSRHISAVTDANFIKFVRLPLSAAGL